MINYDSDPIRFKKLLERIERLRAGAPFDVVHELNEPLSERSRYANLAREHHDNAELRVDLRWTFANRDVTPDTAVRLGGSAIVRDERVQRPLGRTLRRVRLVRQRIEAVERLRHHAAGAGDGVDL